MVEKAPEKTVTYKGTQRISIPPQAPLKSILSQMPSVCLAHTEGSCPSLSGASNPKPAQTCRKSRGLHVLWPALPGAYWIITTER